MCHITGFCGLNNILAFPIAFYLFICFFYDIFRKRFPRILSCVQILWYAPPPTTMSLSSRRPTTAVQLESVFFFRLSYYFSLSSSLWFFWHTRNIGHGLAQNSKRLNHRITHSDDYYYYLYICGHGGLLQKISLYLPKWKYMSYINTSNDPSNV